MTEETDDSTEDSGSRDEWKEESHPNVTKHSPVAESNETPNKVNSHADESGSNMSCDSV